MDVCLRNYDIQKERGDDNNKRFTDVLILFYDQQFKRCVSSHGKANELWFCATKECKSEMESGVNIYLIKLQPMEQILGFVKLSSSNNEIGGRLQISNYLQI